MMNDILVNSFTQPDCDISGYTFERTVLMEERNKILTDLRISSNYHSNDIYHNIKPFQAIPVQSDSEDEATVHDPLLKPTVATSHILTAAANNSINVEQLPPSPTSQLNM